MSGSIVSFADTSRHCGVAAVVRFFGLHAAIRQSTNALAAQAHWITRIDRKALRLAATLHCTAAERGRVAIAAEVLPTILGGEWVESRSPHWPTDRVRHEAMPFDHPLLYRPRGARGRPNWDSSTIVSQPYAASGSFDRYTRAVAAELARDGVTMWHSPAHSYWFPGRTTLVIAAKHIDASRAAALGFRLVAGALQ